MANSKNDGSLLVLLGALCFSGSGTIQAFAPEQATPYAVAALRLAAACVSLLVWCAATKQLCLPRQCSPVKFFLSGLALAGFQITFFLGVESAGVAVGTIVTIAMTPITGAVFGFLFSREVPPKSWYVSTAVAIAGLILLNIQGLDGFKLSGIFFPIAAGTIYAFYLSQSKELVRNNPPIPLMCWLFLLGSFLLAPIWFLFPVQWVFTPRGIAVGLGLGILTTALAYCLVMKGLKTCPTAKAGTLSLGEPLGAAVLGFTVLAEPISLSGFAGVLLIFASVLILVCVPTGKKD